RGLQDTEPVETVEEGRAAAERSEKLPRRIVRLIGDREILWTADERLEQLDRRERRAPGGGDDELGADSGADGPSVERHRPRHDAEKAGDLAGILLKDERGYAAWSRHGWRRNIRVK